MIQKLNINDLKEKADLEFEKDKTYNGFQIKMMLDNILERLEELEK